MGEKRVIVISDLAGGGAQRVVVALAADWLAAGHEVTVITLSGRGEDVFEVAKGVSRITLDCTGRSSGTVNAVGANLNRVLKLRAAISAQHPDKVVSFVAATNILTIAATRGLNLPLVICERNDPARQHLGRFWETMRRYGYRHADKVTANSRQALNTLRAYVPAEKLAFVPNPMPDWSGEPAAVQSGEKLLLAVGRLHPQKGHDRLMKIFAASRAGLLGWRLAIVGEGAERARLEALARKLELGDVLSLPGHQADVRSWYERASLFAMLSHHEGTPNAMIEALSAGLPVLVAKSCVEAADLVTRLGCGDVVDGDNIAQSAEILSDLLLDNTRRRRYAGNGRKGVAGLFAPAIVRKAWEDALTFDFPV